MKTIFCTSQLKPLPFESQGKLGANRGIKSLLNNKLSPKGGSFDVGPQSREKLGTSFSFGASKDGGRREKGKSAFASPFNATMHLLIIA